MNQPFADALFDYAVALNKRYTDLTHAVWPDQPGTRLVQATCGVIISRRNAVDEPTCPRCIRNLARWEKTEL